MAEQVEYTPNQEPPSTEMFKQIMVQIELMKENQQRLFELIDSIDAVIISEDNDDFEIGLN